MDRIQVTYFTDIFQKVSAKANELPTLDPLNGETLINEWVRDFYLDLVEFDWKLLRKRFFPSEE